LEEELEAAGDQVLDRHVGCVPCHVGLGDGDRVVGEMAAVIADSDVACPPVHGYSGSDVDGPGHATIVGVDLGLEGRRALVTAASKGLGRACAEALIGEGAKVFIASRDAVAIEAAGKAIGAIGWQDGDVGKATDVERLVEAAVAKLGGLDVLVVNAGGPPPGTFQATPLEAWDAAYQLTLMSAVRLAHAGLPHLKKSGQGRIVFITSVSVRQPIPNIALSNSLRAAVTGLAKTLAREVGRDGITVNCLAPDKILTDRIRQMAGVGGGDPEEQLKRMAEEAPMGRLGEPSEFAAACAFLCSRQAGYITGQTLGVDGGTLIGVH
jgi:3-oxoacyl-[acyl-carrier protein] reductase